MNYYAVKAIYLHEMDRLWRTLFQSILSPVVSTSLYFIVFGSVIGRMIPEVEWSKLWIVYCTRTTNANSAAAKYFK